MLNLHHKRTRLRGESHRTDTHGWCFVLVSSRAGKAVQVQYLLGSEFQLQIAGRCNTACRLEHSGLSPCFARSARPAPTPFTSVLETSQRAGDWLLGTRVLHPQTCSSNRPPGTGRSSGMGVSATSFGDRNCRTRVINLGNPLSLLQTWVWWWWLDSRREPFIPDDHHWLDAFSSREVSAESSLSCRGLSLDPAYLFRLCSTVLLLGALMAALLVAGSTPGGTRRRLSFRRVERWSDPPQSEERRAEAKKAVELLLWSEIGKMSPPSSLPSTPDGESQSAGGLTASQRSGNNMAVTTSRPAIDGPAGHSGVVS